MAQYRMVTASAYNATMPCHYDQNDMDGTLLLTPVSETRERYFVVVSVVILLGGGLGCYLFFCWGMDPSLCSWIGLGCVWLCSCRKTAGLPEGEALLMPEKSIIRYSATEMSLRLPPGVPLRYADNEDDDDDEALLRPGEVVDRFIATEMGLRLSPFVPHNSLEPRTTPPFRPPGL